MAGRFLILGPGIKAKTGEWDEKNYTRRLPGHPDNIVSLCKKPRYTKAQKKKMANRPTVKHFCDVTVEAQAIKHDPVLRAEWEARHQEARREGSRHNFYVPYRFWDYLRHELSVAKKEAEKRSQNPPI